MLTINSVVLCGISAALCVIKDITFKEISRKFSQIKTQIFANYRGIISLRGGIWFHLTKTYYIWLIKAKFK